MTTTSEVHMTRVPTSKHSDDLDEIRKLTLGLRLAIVGLESEICENDMAGLSAVAQAILSKVSDVAEKFNTLADEAT